MAVRWKIMALILGFTILLNLGVYLVSHSTMFMGYVAVEGKLARDHIDRVRNSLQDDLDALISLNVDWSAWDDTYEFIGNKNSDYIESNLVLSTFDELGLNAIILVDRKGQFVYAGGYDAEEEIIAPLPEGLPANLTAKSPLLDHPDPESRLAGILTLPQGLFLVSSCPVIKSDLTGPIAGSLIMGRFLNQDQLDRLVRLTQLSITLRPLSSSTPEAHSVASSGLEYVNEESIKGNIVLQDIYGQNAFLLEVTIPRDVSLLGRSTLYSFFLWNLLLSSLAAVLIYLVVDRWLSNREDRLESEERFRSMFVHSEAGMCTISKKGKILQVNAAFCRILGYPEEKLIGEELPQLANPIDRGWLSSLFSLGRRSKERGGSFDCRFMHESGRTIWSKVSVGWVSLFNDRSHYAVLMLQDVSDRKRVEDHLKVALKVAQNDLENTKAIMESAADGMILIDNYDKVMRINRSAEKMLEISSHDVTQRRFQSIVESSCLKTLLVEIQSGKYLGHSCDVTLPRLSTGETKHYRFHAAPVVGKQGRREGVVITMHDLTQEFEIDRKKNEIIATAAHELRSPLTAVKGFSQLLLDNSEISAQERQNYIGYIHEKSQVLDNIINDLLDMDRISSGREVVLNVAPVNIETFMADLFEQYKKTWPEHEFEIDMPEENLNIDPVKIQRVLSNLLDNAVKYTPSGGKVRMTGKRLESEFRICVEDSGLGMTADELDKVFDKFYRARSTEEIADGIGLGLTISKEIVEAHGGRIWLNSIYGEGTRVYLSLPIQAP